LAGSHAPPLGGAHARAFVTNRGARPSIRGSPAAAGSQRARRRLIARDDRRDS
jgi:hypothetical protein